MRPNVEIERFREFVAIVRANFPELTVVSTEEVQNVDAAADIAVQPSLSLAIHVNLQGDELHLNVGPHFSVEWFPCADQHVFERFADAVTGCSRGNTESSSRGLEDTPCRRDCRHRRVMGGARWRDGAS